MSRDAERVYHVGNALGNHSAFPVTKPPVFAPIDYSPYFF
jgi:hypothetical protein